jgi:hypothetical protein
VTWVQAAATQVSTNAITEPRATPSESELHPVPAETDRAAAGPEDHPQVEERGEPASNSTRAEEGREAEAAEGAWTSPLVREEPRQ